MAKRRDYYRCKDCLGVFAVEESLMGARCDCGGTRGFWWLGYVHQFRLAKDHLEIPCDARCTNAIGPSCDCPCGGENHGTRMVVRRVVDAGGIPRVSAPEELEARLARRARTEELVAQVRAAYVGLYGNGNECDRQVYAKKSMKGRERAAARAIEWTQDLRRQYGMGATQ